MKTRIRLTIVAVAAVVLPIGAALAADPPPLRTIVAVEFAGWEACLPSEKDAGLRRAISMLPARAKELHATVPDLQEIPEPVLDVALSLAGRPMRLAVTNKGFDPDTGVPGIGVTISFRMDDEASARGMHERLDAIRAMAGEDAGQGLAPKPSARHAGMLDVQLPVGILTYGPRRAADGWRYEVLFGAVDDPDAMFGGLPAAPNAPAGFTPAVRAVVDLSAISPFVQMLGGVAAIGSPEAKVLMSVLTDHGLLGPNAVAIEMVKGYAPDAAAAWITIRRLGPVAKSAGLLDEPLTDADLALVPADATAAHVHRADLNAWFQQLKRDAIRLAGEPEVARGLAEFTRATGLDLERDIFAPLGRCGAFYLSDSTGGGALTSAAAVVRLSEPARMKTSLDALASLFNREIRKEVVGPVGVGFASFDRGGASYAQLRFAGVPIPFSPTYAVTGEALVLGAQGQACVAAAEQVKRGAGGLGSHAAFKAARWSTPSPPTAVWFIDSARTIRDGYSMTAMLGTMIENAVRSPSSFGGPGTGEREPGMVVPTMSELAANARPIIGLGYWLGDDYVIEFRSDRSVLVTVTAMLGVGEAASLIEGAILGAGAAEAGDDRRDHRDHRWNDGDDDDRLRIREEADDESPDGADAGEREPSGL